MQTPCAAFFSFFRLLVQGLYSATVISDLALLTFSPSRLWRICKDSYPPTHTHPNRQVQQMARKIRSPPVCLLSCRPEAAQMTKACPHMPKPAGLGRPHQLSSRFDSRTCGSTWDSSLQNCAASELLWGALSSRCLPPLFTPHLTCQSIPLQAAKPSRTHSDRSHSTPVRQQPAPTLHPEPFTAPAPLAQPHKPASKLCCT